MLQAADLIRPHIRAMAPYRPIRPLEVLSDQLGIPAEKIIKLDGNENPYGPAPAAAQALAGLRYPHIYPDPQAHALRQALADYSGVPPENLLVGAGADELIDLVMRLFLEPGDAVVNCPPTFGMYAFDAHLNAARLVEVPRRPDFSLDLPALERAVREGRPKLLFLCSPNNPDGGLLEDQALERLLDLPVVVVLDEAYVEFAPPGSSRIREVLRRPNLVVLRTFSKWAGLAGLRVGYGAFPAALMPYLWRIKQPYNLSVAAQAAALASLQQVALLRANVARLVQERQRLFAGLAGIPYLRPYPSQANFILCRVVGRQARALKGTLAQRGILVRHFDTPRLADHIRISVGKPQHSQALLDALQEME